MAWIESRITKNGKRWYVREKVNGKIISRPAGPMKETAKTIRNTMSNQAVLKENGLADPQMSLQKAVTDYIALCENSNLEPSTIRIKKDALENKLLKFFGSGARLLDVGPTDMERFKGWLLTDQGHSVNTAHIHLRTCKTFFLSCEERGLITKTPASKCTKKLKTEQVWRVLSFDETERLRAACRFNTRGLWDIIKFALYTGLRRGELIGLKNEYIRNGKIYLPWGSNKTKTARAIPIHSDIKYIVEMRQRQEFIFDGWKKDGLNRSFERAVGRAKLGRVRLHDLRHTFASNYLEFDAGNQKDLMSILGHTSFAMTQKYVHALGSKIEERIQKYSLGQPQQQLQVVG